jgi:predicted NAD/FAD-dependent oxidoreductase
MAKYIDNDDAIRYISLENRKLGVTDQQLEECILLHSSVPFGVTHRDSTDDTVIRLMMESLHRIVPELASRTALSVKLVNWKESQVSNSTPPGLPPSFVVSLPVPGRPGQSLRLGFAGDAFTESNFEGCLRSAEDLAIKLANTITAEREVNVEDV